MRIEWENQHAMRPGGFRVLDDKDQPIAFIDLLEELVAEESAAEKWSQFS